MAQAKSKQAKVVEQAAVEVEQQPVTPVKQQLEAFYYNHNPQSEVRNTFDVYLINSTTGRKDRVKQDLYIAEAREAAYNINVKLGLDRVERIYSI